MNAATEVKTSIDALRDAQHRLERQERRLAMVLMSGVKGVGQSEAALDLNASIAEIRGTIEAISAPAL